MSTTKIQAAQKGQRKAMTFLYEANKRKVCYLAECLLLDNVQAASVSAWVFKNIWDCFEFSSIKTEEEFTYLAIEKAVDYCKTRIWKDNPKAFKVPKNRNFLFQGEKIVSNGEKVVFEILAQFPELHRFILVLHTVGGCSTQQIAKILKVDGKSIESAIEAEKNNVEGMISNQNGNHLSYEFVAKMMCDSEKDYIVPEKIVDEQVLAVIDAIAIPIEKKRKKTIGIVSAVSVGFCVCIAILVVAIYAGGNVHTTGGTGSTSGSGSTSDQTYTPKALDEKLTYYADIVIEEYGSITVQLDQKSAPISSANFVELAKSGFYDGLTFHRIVEGFMMQGGDPKGNGTGGSENKIIGEFSKNGYKNDLSHTRGAISMARSSAYNSASSQFFIVQEDTARLDGEYAVFGYVTKGMEVVDAVCEGNNGILPKAEQPVIKSIKIRTE